MKPCKKGDSYSENLCILKWGWERKFDKVHSHVGDRFACKIPGIWTNEPYAMPVCNHFAAYNETDSLGLADLVVRSLESQLVKFDQEQLLVNQPIGIYQDTSDCKPRCTSYTYSLIQEEISPYDDDMQDNDLFLYFASSRVETWSEYRILSGSGFLNGIGGLLGLILGMSILSLLHNIIDVVVWTGRNVIRRIRMNCSVRNTEKP